MFQPMRVAVRSIASVLSLALVLLGSAAGAAPKEVREPASFNVDARVALGAFMSLADAHLQKMADTLRVLALSEEARSADWKLIERPLAEVAKTNAPALNWFALKDGSYWSVQNGREKANLSDRAYFPRVLAGNVVLGDLVVSKATGKSIAVVAVPVHGRDGSVVGALGASIYLDELSTRLRDQLGLGEEYIFFSFDSEPLLALVWDSGLIFTNPKQLGPDVERAFSEMLTRREGIVRYTFRERPRTVVFRKSSVTGWWYGLGRVGPKTGR
ncbi:MAG TPA: hypothetical protein VGK67_24605 [Myxococcales bacterium]|jgi:methyl-accepting chemotaxis protein